VIADSVAAVVVNYRNWGDTELCVRAIERQSYPVSGIIIVNNDGAETVPAWTASHRIRIVQPASNVGFARGCNLGAALAAEAGADALWFVNNDACPEPTALEALREARRLAGEDFGACSSLIVYARDPLTVQWAAGELLPFAIGVRVRSDKRYEDWKDLPPQRVSFVPGCSFLMDTARYQQLGGLGDDYFAYFEDVDLSQRLRRERLSMWLAPRSVVRHKGSASGGGVWSDFGAYLCSRNRLWVARRFGLGYLSALMAACAQLAWMVKRSLYGQQVPWRRTLAGIMSGLGTLRPSPTTRS